MVRALRACGHPELHDLTRGFRIWGPAVHKRRSAMIAHYYGSPSQSREVNDDVDPFRGRNAEAIELRHLGQEATIRPDLKDRTLRIEGQVQYTRIAGVQNTETIPSRLHFEVRPGLAVNTNDVPEEVLHPLGMYFRVYSYGGVGE